MKVALTPKLTYAELIQKTVAELAPMLKDCVTTFKSIETATAKFAGNIQQWAKVTAAFQVRYTAQLNDSAIPANTSFKDYLKQNAGGEIPARVYALASLFNTLVMTNDKDGNPLLSEKHFDAAKVDWLEKANAIVGAARKANPNDWTTTDAVQETLEALSEPGDAGKLLKKIRARQKGETEDGETGETGSAATTAVPLTLGRCVEFMKAAILTLAVVPTDEAGKNAQYETACGFFALERAFASVPTAITDPLLNRYVENEKRNAAPHLAIVAPPAHEMPKETRAQRRARMAAEKSAAPAAPVPEEQPAELLAA